MKRNRPALLIEWREEGSHAHCHAEQPSEFPGIVCATVEERDGLLEAWGECERLRKELSSPAAIICFNCGATQSADPTKGEGDE